MHLNFPSESVGRFRRPVNRDLYEANHPRPAVFTAINIIFHHAKTSDVSHFNNRVQVDSGPGTPVSMSSLS